MYVWANQTPFSLKVAATTDVRQLAFATSHTGGDPSASVKGMLVHYDELLGQPGVPPRAVALHGEHMRVLMEARRVPPCRARCDALATLPQPFERS